MTDWLSPATLRKLAADKLRQAEAQSTDLPIFAPHNGTETSRRAAREALPHVHSQAWAVLRALVEAPNGLTRSELIRATGIVENAVNPRVWTLRKKGLVEERGERDGRAVLYATESAKQAQREAA